MSTSNLQGLAKSLSSLDETGHTMPAIFVGHGAPTYVLGNNPYSTAWHKIGGEMPKPKAILVVSAHWLTPGKTQVTAMPKPRTIHDFGGFQKEMYEFQYPAPGSPELASDISNAITSPSIEFDHAWGFDHGTWTVLYHMFPQANIPVLQLSIDYNQPASFQYELGKQLKQFRKKGVLIVGSGNIVHNLRRIDFRNESGGFDWAKEFDEQSKALIDKGDHQSLVNYEKLGQAALLSIPTPDHYFPLMYVLGLQDDKDRVSYPVEGLSYGSTSMRAVMFRPS
jgi:4,5-DOPA dioxygenase extradiol